MKTFAERFLQQFPGRPALLMTDQANWNLAGRDLYGALKESNVPVLRPHVSDGTLTAAAETLDAVKAAIAHTDAHPVPVAVGGGDIADCAKLLAADFRGPWALFLSRPDSVSAASPLVTETPETLRILQATPGKPVAPGLVGYDLPRLLRAPADARAAGYGDLFSKFAAGADWLLAAAVGETAIPPQAWEAAQDRLVSRTIHPKELADGDAAALQDLVDGLLDVGRACTLAQSPYPARGAEDLFAQVWTLSAHATPLPHGKLAALGSLCALVFYITLLRTPFTPDCIPAALATYPDWAAREAMISSLLPEGALRSRILSESRAKHLSPEALRQRLAALADGWEDLREKLDRQLMYFPRMRAMLLCAGCPVTPADIGLTPARAAASAIVAQMLSRRYTVLDLAYETGRFADCVAALQDAFEIDRTPATAAAPTP